MHVYKKGNLAIVTHNFNNFSSKKEQKEYYFGEFFFLCQK